MEPLVIGILGFLAYRITLRVLAAEKFSFAFYSIPAVQITGDALVITLPISVTNNSNETFMFSRFWGTVVLNTLYIGSFTLTEPFEAKARSVSLLRISITSTLTSAVLAIVNLFAKKTAGRRISVKGFVEVNSIVLPVNFSKVF